MRTDGGAQRRLDAPYVAEHLQHAYALTAHTIQGATVEWAGVVGRPEDFTRNWSYTALSRAREPTELFILDTPTERELDRAEIAPGQARGLRDERTPIERLEAAMRQRDDEDLALDRLDTERHRGPAHLEPAHAGACRSPARPSLSCRPSSRSFASASATTPSTSSTSCTPPAAPRPRRNASLTSARARIAELEQPARGVLRRRAADSAERAFERQRLKLAEGEIAAAAERERNLAEQHPRPHSMGGRTPRRSASAPPSSTRSSRPAAASTCASRSSDQLPTSRKRSALSLTSRALGAPGSKPPRASRPTASTTPSPTPATRSDRPRATSASARTGNVPTTTSNALNETSVTATPASTPTRSRCASSSGPAAAPFVRCDSPAGRRNASPFWLKR